MPVAGEEIKRILMAKIASAHGVKGLVKLQPFCEDISLLDTLEIFTSERGGDTLELTIRHADAKHVLAEIEGVQDRDAAQALKNTELWADRAALPEPDEDEYYFEDLKGLAVKHVNGGDAGQVLAVQDFGAGALLEIRPPKGASYYLPFTGEYIPEVNLENGFLVIDPPEGLIE